MSEFLTDVQTLRQRAREHIDRGPITDAYGADRERVIQVLNEVLATELVCYLRSKRHCFTAKGLNATNAEAEFLQHASDEHVAIASYQEIIRSLGNDDPMTRNMIETILAVEEEHAEDMLHLLDEIG